MDVTTVNDAPVITGQSPLSTPEETALAITLGALTVTDPDNTYPTDFTLAVQDGSDYSRAGNTITPVADFIGTLTVPVTVNDGTDNSNVFNLSVEVLDNTPPVISLIGDSIVTVEVNSNYNDDGATALDNYDGDISSNISTSGTVDTSIVGDYTVKYNVSDSSGNAATQVTRTVQVRDTTPPLDPTVSSTDQPITTPTNDDTVDLSWNVGSDTGSGVAGYSWMVDQLPVNLPDDEVEEMGLPSTINLGAEDGDYYIHVRTKDNAGNWTSTYHYGPWQLDQTPPGFPLFIGFAATNDTTPTWTWSSGGNGIGSFRYKLDNSDLTSGATETTTTAFTPASPLVEGSHTLYVQERDDAGNWSDSGSFETIVDTTAPVSPAQGRDPVDGQINVPVDTSIVIHVKDIGSFVDQNTIVMTVEGVGVDPVVTGIPSDYTLTYDGNFDYEQEVNITVDASDLAGNPMIQENYSFITEPKTGNPWDPEGDEDEDDIPYEVEHDLLGTNHLVKTLFVRPKKETGFLQYEYWTEFIQLFPDTRSGFADVPPFTHAGIEISVIGDPNNPYEPMRNFDYDPAQDPEHPPCDILEIVYKGDTSYCAYGHHNYGHTYFSSIGLTWHFDTKGYVPHNEGTYWQQHHYFTPQIYPFPLANYFDEGAYDSIKAGQIPNAPQGDDLCPFSQYKQCYYFNHSNPMNWNKDDPVNGLPDDWVEFNEITFDSATNKEITYVGAKGKDYTREEVLRRTIVHEMGHGILAASEDDHCSDPQCIMYGFVANWEMSDFGPGNCVHSPGGAKDIRARGVIHNSIHY